MSFSFDHMAFKEHVCQFSDFYHHFIYAFQQNLKIRPHLAAILDTSAILNVYIYHDQHVFLKKYLHRNILASAQTAISIFTMVPTKP